MKTIRIILVASSVVFGLSLFYFTPGMAQSISSTTWYNIVSAQSGLCVDDAGGSSANGTSVQEWTCQGGNTNQEWQFQPTSNGYYKVVSFNSASEVWDVTNLSTADGALIQLWSFGGGANQQWQPQAIDSTHYKFVNLNSAKCLDNSGSTTTGTQFKQWTCQSGNINQSYTLTAVGGGPTPTVQPPTNTPTGGE